ncbi:hypothetical protein DXG01_011796 [Tephrocybe rancida]|nr:hypothetical protein DXG01_011796 [Tephrocybe rancida]
MLLTQKGEDGWQAELSRYLRDVPKDVDADTDIVSWWSDHAKMYPTFARMALNVLPCQASSVPCKHIFSSSQLTTMDHCTRPRSEMFEKLQILKHIWRPELVDTARSNSDKLNSISIVAYESLLAADSKLNGWDKQYS